VLEVVGLGLIVAGLWLIWDLVNRIMWGWVTGEKVQDFEFPFPFFIAKVTYRNWTLVYDVGMTLVLIGYFVTLYSARL